MDLVFHKGVEYNKGMENEMVNIYGSGGFGYKVLGGILCAERI